MTDDKDPDDATTIPPQTILLRRPGGDVETLRLLPDEAFTSEVDKILAKQREDDANTKLTITSIQQASEIAGLKKRIEVLELKLLQERRKFEAEHLEMRLRIQLLEPQPGDVESLEWHACSSGTSTPVMVREKMLALIRRSKNTEQRSYLHRAALAQAIARLEELTAMKGQYHEERELIQSLQRVLNGGCLSCAPEYQCFATGEGCTKEIK